MRNLTFFLSLIIFLSLTGCNSNVLESLSDDSSSAADIEAARMAIDDGNYQKAIDILEPGCNQTNPDLEIARILASAYMGKAGIDLTYVLENASDGNNDSFDVLTSALSLDLIEGSSPENPENPPMYISFSSVQAFLENLEKAMAYLETLVLLYGNDDDKVQLGMASAIHFILKIGSEAAAVKGTDIPINKAAYREVFPEDTDWETDLDTLAGRIPLGGGIADSLQNDLTYLSVAVDVLKARMDPDEDIEEDFNEFLTEVLGGASIADFDGQEIANYIESYLLEYV